MDDGRFSIRYRFPFFSSEFIEFVGDGFDLILSLEYLFVVVHNSDRDLQFDGLRTMSI